MSSALAELEQKDDEFMAEVKQQQDTLTKSQRHIAFQRALSLWPLANRIMPTIEFYVCSLCLRQYNLMEDLRGHMIEYHNYVCTGQQPKVLEQALEPDLHAESGNNKQCELAPMFFKDFRLLLRAKMKLKCAASSCKSSFETELQLSQHMQCHIQNPANNMQFKCLQCQFKASSWRRCSAHLWREHQIDVDQLKCPICKYKAHASVLVWRHMRLHAKWRALVLRSLKRAQAKKMVNNKRQIDKTQAIVNKNKYYAEKTCDICERKFVNGKTLSKHVKTVHNKVKPFICNVCGKKTSRKAGLEIHMRQHTGEKPLKCKVCKFATRDPSVLHKHQLRHENTTKGKFQCNVCDYVCIQTNTYKRHLRINHPEEYKKVACNLCTYVTIRADKLQKHLHDHRKGLILDPEDSLDETLTHKINMRKQLDKNDSFDCFLPLESVDSMPHDPALDTGGVTIPAPPSEDTQFPSF